MKPDGVDPLALRPCSVSAALAYVASTHRRLPRLQGGMFAVSVVDPETLELRGVAIVGNAPCAWMKRGALAITRVAVPEGVPNGCSMLYGACSRAAKALGATDLVTFTHADEGGASLRAAGWVNAGVSRGGARLQTGPSQSRHRRQDPLAGAVGSRSEKTCSRGHHRSDGEVTPCSET